ncbi:MAG TPA: sigma-54 dependent transcriptional regulator [Archangium sp.]|uniref:sigma-54 interaction domain-containing protein n=1 Tax=Archangium sp. TaxID=1872627 RepID=UPI002E3551F0|nr:sigma-54 dependent transcriptional regulator [Archangium sp.]HEX5749553.1 sigma-54 dependent transcriptional regulator [Archangium sp.]
MTTPILGTSGTHAQLLEFVASAASSDAEVLIQGPSGVGKELYARRIHELSARAQAAFVPVNCGALPADLFENELFGHAHGAFTGARTRSNGLAAEAHQGTLFLDEIDSLPLASQVKLLRFIQLKEYRPLGDPRLRHSDARIIAATNADLVTAVREGRFRADLFFRLRVLPLVVPPLRERREDIPALLEHFLRRYAAEYGKPPVSFSRQALQHLYAYDWPGNIRELENCVRYLLCTRSGGTVHPEELPLLSHLEQETAAASPPESAAALHQETFQSAKRRVVSAFERQYLQRTLQAHHGNIAAAARASGKHRRAFFELMRRHGLTREQ